MNGFNRVEELLKSELKEQNYSKEFWKSLFTFIEQRIQTYNNHLVQKEIYLLTAAEERKMKENLADIQEKVLNLTETIRTIKNNQKNTEELEKLQVEALKLKEERDKLLQEREQSNENFKWFKETKENEIRNQEKQVRKSLSKNFQVARDELKILSDVNYRLQLSEDQELFRLSGKADVALRNIVNILEENQLWPDLEKKPNFLELQGSSTSVEKKKSISRLSRSRKKKDITNSITGQGQAESNNEKTLFDYQSKGLMNESECTQIIEKKTEKKQKIASVIPDDSSCVEKDKLVVSDDQSYTEQAVEVPLEDRSTMGETEERTENVQQTEVSLEISAEAVASETTDHSCEEMGRNQEVNEAKQDVMEVGTKGSVDRKEGITSKNE